ncbi:MAG: nucleotidyltransferase family protein [Ignavibacteriae bacterium]|nr:nucleotidyltransferase family protein [Ignavibacteriota bacterium]
MKVINKIDIVEMILLNKEKISEFGINSIGLFGSYVRNKNTESSDIDFIVRFNEGKKNYKNFIHLFFFLSHLFQKKVELLTEESLSPYLRENILKEVEYVAI